jgi:hypothetical protein
METKTIGVSKKAPLVSRISETGRRVRDWLNVLEVPFDHAMDKLQLKKCEVVHDHCVYHYGIVRGTPLFSPENNRAIFAPHSAVPNHAGKEEMHRKSLECISTMPGLS